MRTAREEQRVRRREATNGQKGTEQSHKHGEKQKNRAKDKMRVGTGWRCSEEAREDASVLECERLAEDR